MQGNCGKQPMFNSLLGKKNLHPAIEKGLKNGLR